MALFRPNKPASVKLKDAQKDIDAYITQQKLRAWLPPYKEQSYKSPSGIVKPLGRVKDNK